MHLLQLFISIWMASGLLETTNLFIDGFIQSANNTGLKCFSCREPEWKSAEFLFNNRTEDSLRYDEISKQCFHSKGLCHPNSCSCSKYGNEFIRIFPVDIHRHRNETTFSCVMHFVDFRMSLNFLKIASVIFNGTDFIPLTTITKITKAAEMDKEVNSSRNETKTTVPTEIEVGPTYQFHVKWVTVVCIIVIMFVVIAFIIVCLYKKNLTKKKKTEDSVVNGERKFEAEQMKGIKDDKNVKDFEKEPLILTMSGEKHADSAVNVERATETLPLTGIKDDKNVKDFEKEPLILTMSGEKHADSAVNVERATETLPLTGIKDDKYITDFEKEPLILTMSGGKYDNYVKDVEKKPVISQLNENVTDDKVLTIKK